MSHTHHSKHQAGTPVRWRIDVEFEEEDGEAVATVDLYAGEAIYEAHGRTHAAELDASAARQIAVARALSGLGRQLVDDASRTVDRVARAVSTASQDAEDTYVLLEQLPALVGR